VDFLKELMRPAELVYVVPIAIAAMLVILRRVGFEVDIMGALDTLGGPNGKGSWFASVRRRLFPTGGMLVLRGALFAFGWATTGIGLNHGLGEIHTPWFHVLIFALACTIGFWSAWIGSRVFFLFLPSEQKTTSLEDFVGGTATVISERIDGDHGRARIVDERRNTVTVYCRHVGEGESPKLGEAVKLVRYDPSQRVFDVIR